MHCCWVARWAHFGRLRGADARDYKSGGRRRRNRSDEGAVDEPAGRVRESSAAAGFACPIAPPMILVVDVPSFGNYDPQSNTLNTPAWEQLTDGERSRFYRLLGPGTSEAAARGEFETGAHHWGPCTRWVIGGRRAVGSSIVTSITRWNSGQTELRLRTGGNVIRR